MNFTSSKLCSSTYQLYTTCQKTVPLFNNTQLSPPLTLNMFGMSFIKNLMWRFYNLLSWSASMKIGVLYYCNQFSYLPDANSYRRGLSAHVCSKPLKLVAEALLTLCRVKSKSINLISLSSLTDCLQFLTVHHNVASHTIVRNPYGYPQWLEYKQILDGG